MTVQDQQDILAPVTVSQEKVLLVWGFSPCPF
jgi:hypothetical protein